MDAIYLIEFMLLVYIGLVDGYSYKLFKNQDKTYTEAYNKCESEGLELAAVKTIHDHDQLLQYILSVGGIASDVYIGMIWDNSSSLFRWSDNTPITWALWATDGYPSEPNCMTGYQSLCTIQQDCVRLTTQYEFRTSPCSVKYDVLCGEGFVNDYIYKVFKNQDKTYTEANNKCESEGLELAAIKTSQDHDQLHQYILSVGGITSDVYIGMTWDNSSSLFRWSDNTPITWALWSPDGYPPEPNCMSGYLHFCNPQQDCVRLTTDYEFRTSICSVQYDVLCGKENELTSTYPGTRISTNDYTTSSLVSTDGLMTKSITNSTGTTPTSVDATPTSDGTTPTSTGTTPTFVGTMSTSAGKTQTSIGTTPNEYSLTMLKHIPYTTTSLAAFSSDASTVITNYEGTFEITSCPYYDKGTSPVEMLCTCPAEHTNYKWNYLLQPNITADELRRIVENDFEDNIKPHIKVEKTVLSKYKRAKTSAPDERTSSESMGALSVILIAIPVVFIVTSDIFSIIQKRKHFVPLLTWLTRRRR